MKISWINLDKHNEKNGESIIPKVQVINNRPIAILYNVGNENLFRNMALEQAGFKFSKQGIWVSPIDVMDLAALQAAFPLMEFESQAEAIDHVVEKPKDSPNSFLATMLRNSIQEEYAPDINVKRYEGTLPPAGESLLTFVSENGRQVSDHAFEMNYAAGTNATITFNKPKRWVSVLFHDVEFHNDLKAIHATEQASFQHVEVGTPFAFQSKVFFKLSEGNFAPAVMSANGPIALTSLVFPSPQEVLRRIDIETLAKVMPDSELVVPEQEAEEATTVADAESIAVQAEQLAEELLGNQDGSIDPLPESDAARAEHLNNLAGLADQIASDILTDEEPAEPAAPAIEQPEQEQLVTEASNVVPESEKADSEPVELIETTNSDPAASEPEIESPQEPDTSFEDRSERYQYLAHFMAQNPYSAITAGFINELQMDLDLNDGEAEVLIELSEGIKQDLPAFKSAQHVILKLDAADNSFEVNSIWQQVQSDIESGEFAVTAKDKTDIYSTVRNRIKDIEDEERIEEAAEATTPDTENDHWSSEFVNQDTAEKIDQLEASAAKHGHNVNWFTIYREASGTQLIARIDNAKYDVIFNDEGTIQQAPSLLDLYIKTKRANAIRSTDLVEPVQETEIIEVNGEAPAQAESPKYEAREAGLKGEYGLDDRWYSAGETIPVEALDPEIAKPEEDLESQQELIYPRINKFVSVDGTDTSTLIRKEQIKDSELVNFFNSVEQFNALVERFNSGKRFYSPEWLMLNYSPVAEVSATLPNGPIGSEAVTPSTQINFSAIVRDSAGTPFMVLTKRHGKMQIAEFVDGKPQSHEDSPIVDCDGATYFFDNEYWVDEQIASGDAPQSIEEIPSDDAETYYSEGLTELVSKLDNLIDSGKGKYLDAAAKALRVAKRKKGETNSERQQRLLETVTVIKEYANSSVEAVFKDNQLPEIKGILDTLDIPKTGTKKVLCEKIFKHFESLGQSYLDNKERMNLLIQLADKVENGEAVTLDDIAAAKGVAALRTDFAYTPGDVQVAKALDETQVRPEGQRNQYEAVYRAAAEFIKDPINFIINNRHIEADVFKAFINKARSIQNQEMLTAFVSQEFQPIADGIGLPEGISFEPFILALQEDLENAPAFDMSYQPLEVVTPSFAEPEIEEGKGYALPDSFSDSAERWKHIKSGDSEAHSHESNLIALVREAINEGAENFFKAKDYILENYPDFFPEDKNIGTPSGAILTEVTFAWQFVKANAEQGVTPVEAVDETIEPEADTASTGSNVVSLHQNLDLEDDEEVAKAYKKQLAILESADITIDEVYRYMVERASLERSSEQEDIPSLETQRFKKELEQKYDDINNRAAKAGIALEWDLLLTTVEKIKHSMGQYESFSEQPWLMSAQSLFVLPENAYLELARVIPADLEIEKALFAAKRFGNEAQVRIIENILEGKQEASDSIIADMVAELDKAVRINELETQIDSFKTREENDQLTSFEYDQVKQLREERAELKFKISEIQITDELEQIFAESPSYMDAADTIAKKLGIDYRGASLLCDRISDYRRDNYIAEAKSKPDFVIGLEVMSHLEGFIREDEDNIESIGHTMVGPNKGFLDKPKIENGNISVSVLVSSIDRHHSDTEHELFEVAEDHPTAAQELASQINAYINGFRTVVDTTRLPEYGSKLHSGPNGDKLYNLTEINKRIRQDYKELEKQGVVPKGVKLSVTKSHGSISIRIKELPDSIPMINPEYAKWKRSNPDAFSHEGPSLYTAEYRALAMAVESVAEAYNYDNSDSQTDYFSTNFYLNIEADSDFRSEQIAKAIALVPQLEAAEEDAVEPKVKEVPQPESEEVTLEDPSTPPPAKAKIRDRLYALPYEADLEKADESLLSITQDIRDYSGAKTGWKGTEISQDDLGFKAGGGTLLVNPNTLEIVAFKAGERSSNEAYHRAAHYAMDNPPAEATATQESTEVETEKTIANDPSNNVITVLKPDLQKTKAETNIAELLLQLDLTRFSAEEEFVNRVVKNPPYMDLHIEVHPFISDEIYPALEDEVKKDKVKSIHLTHYSSANGDTCIDAEMIYVLTEDGSLVLAETRTVDPLRGGEISGKDAEFASLFSSNLLAQGFGDCHPMDPEAVEASITNEESTPAEAPKEIIDIDNIPAPELKELIETRYDDSEKGLVDSTMMLAYRYAVQRVLERADNIAARFDNDGELTDSDRAILTNLRNSFVKTMESEIEEGNNHDPRSTNNQSETTHSDNVESGIETGTGEEGPDANVSRNQQSDDHEEGRTSNDTVSRTESSTAHQRLSGASKLPSGSAELPERDANASDSEHSTLQLIREIDFFPAEEIRRIESGSSDDLRIAFKEAIETYIDLKESGRKPTPEEKLKLTAFGGTAMPVIRKQLENSNYTGGVQRDLSRALDKLFKEHPEATKSLKASTVDSYYTPSDLSEFMWNAVTKLGIQNAEHTLNITEPSMGNGRFIGMAPEAIRKSANIKGVEKDLFTSEVAQMAYDEVEVITSGFEDIVLPTDSQDLVIGNPPYGDFTVYDSQDKRQRLIHDYFLKRSIELTKPGGLVAFVTSSGTMDKTNGALRRLVSESADLVTAYRLPSSVFKGAGAEVVTDVLFFRKRHQDEEPSNLNWLKTSRFHLEGSMVDGKPQEAKINQYYLDNPDHVLGELKWTSGSFGRKVTVEGEITTADYDRILKDIPTDLFSAKETTETKLAKSEAFNDPRFATAKVGSYVETEDGIFVLSADGMIPHTAKGKRSEKISALIALRDTTLLLLDAEHAANTDEATKQRAILNTQYDEFVTAYGSLNESRNKNLLSLDPDQFLVLALEHKDGITGEFNKSDIFTVAFQGLNQKTTSIESISDAALFLLNTEGHIDHKKVADLLSIDEIEAEKGLKEICFKNPTTASWELNGLYLSGNIYEKIQAAKNAKKFNPEYQRNIEALEEAIPAPIDIESINIRLGASWIPQSIVQEFIAEQLGSKPYDDRVRLTFVKETHSWDLRMTQAARNEFHNQNEFEYAATGLRFDQLMTLTLNQKRATIKDKDGNINGDATALAKVKQRALISSFQQFVLNNPKYAQAVADSYNRIFNAYKEADYDGSYMTFPGMSGTINGNPLKLRDHQPAVIERVLHSETGVLIAHEAGAGKTIEQIAAAMEMKRLGMASKPLVVIPNHMLAQATNEARDLYPNAKILTASKEDFSSNGRALFANKVRMNDWDIVICTHSMFSSMSSPAEFTQGYIEEEIAEFESAMLETDHENKIALRELEKGKKKLESKLKSVINKMEDNQDSICFGECGFDALFYDEGHYLKNYAPPTSLSDVAGVNTSTSDRAMDAVIKADYIRHIRSDKKGVYLATGTPITNSVSEIWVMLRITAPELLREADLYSFDNFAATFCEVVEHVELKPEGDGYQSKARLSRFHNVPELIRIFRMVADIKTAEDLNLPTPKANELRHVAPQSEVMAEFMDWLSHRAGGIRDGSVDITEDNILSIANDGRMASLDLRLIHEDLPDDPNSKVNECVQNVFAKYIEHAEDQRTQIVFCDRGTPKKEFNLYDDMKKKWVDMGIPPEEIAFIHEAKNDAQKEAIFEKVRAGKIRILLGSTDKMGVGTNVQTRGSDLHMLDIPWRPTDLTQRRKRLERQGNLFDDVNIHFYTTEDSFDLFMLETVVRKLKFITQALSSPEKAARRLDEDVDPSLSEIMAITSGNPLIREKVEVDSQVEQLQLLENAHLSDIRRAASEVRWLEHNTIPIYKEDIQNYESAIKAIPSEFAISVDGVTYNEPKKAGLAIHKKLKTQFGGGHEVAEVGGYPLVSRVYKDRYALEWMGPAKTEVYLTKDPKRFTTNLFNNLGAFELNKSRSERRLEEALTERDKYEQKSKRSFAQEGELSDLRARQLIINSEIEKLDQGTQRNTSSEFMHDFEIRIEELNARKGLLSDDELDLYAQATAANKPETSLPGM